MQGVLIGASNVARCSASPLPDQTMAPSTKHPIHCISATSPGKAGQVKVKGQLGEMAKCTEDKDRRIRDMSRMFFTELSTKDNAVYNQFVDMFSVLSADESVEEEAFKRIIKFLLSFIEKVCYSMTGGYCVVLTRKLG